MLMTNIKEPSPGTLKIGRIMGSKSVPINSITPNPINNSEPIKKGSNAGKTI